jgi:glycosyltransferase involved in cell wall biosynthesis
MHVALIGTYPPRRCGIATFTADVEDALARNNVRITMVPVVMTHGDAVGPLSIRRDDRASYGAVARALNALDVDVTLIQHEFGIFGGGAGAFILSLTEQLRMPVVVTMHTVLPVYTDDQASVVAALGTRAALTTVMTESARDLLARQDLVPLENIVVIPHGAPEELFEVRDLPCRREQWGVPAGVPVMTTFGLLSEGKGIELALRAMSVLRDEHPDLHYVVAGRTHPDVVEREGECYRQSLVSLSVRLGLTDRVHFVDRFLDLGELAGLLGFSSLVCTPYRGEDQSVSGVLTYALAAGRPVVSTPFRYAEALLADGAGLTASADDVDGFAAAIASMLDGPLATSARRAARAASEAMPWPRVGNDLRRTLATCIARPRPVASAVVVPLRTRSDDTVLGLSHPRVLCDDAAVLRRMRNFMT